MDHHTQEISGDKAQFVQRALILGRRRLSVDNEARRRRVQRARLTEDVARVHHAKVFLGEAALGARVGVDCAEAEAREGVAVFGDMGCGVAQCGDYFAEGRVFPKDMSVGGRRERSRPRTR